MENLKENVMEVYEIMVRNNDFIESDYYENKEEATKRFNDLKSYEPAKNTEYYLIKQYKNIETDEYIENSEVEIDSFIK